MMPNVKIKGFGDGGVVYDLMPWELQPNQLTLANNVRFIDGAMQSSDRVGIYPSAPTVTSPRWIHAWERVEDSEVSVVIAGDGKLILSSNSGPWQDVTNPAPGLYGPVQQAYSYNDWQSFTWGRAVVFNNGAEVPQWFAPGDSTFVDLPNWDTHPGTKTTCRVIRPYKSYMIAMDITDDGVRQENQVGWSDAAEPNLPPPSWDWSDPTTVAGRNPLSPDTGRVVDGLTLGDQFMIYCESGAYGMRESGGTFVFDFRRAIPYGAINHDCVVAFQQFHFVIGQDRIYTTDGFTVQFPAERVVEDLFFSTLANRKSVRVEHYQRTNEIIIFYNTISDGRRALIWNYISNTWAPVGFGPVGALTYGPFQPATPETYATITSTYATETRAYNSFSIEALGQFLYLANDAFNNGLGEITPAIVLLADRTKVIGGGMPTYLGGKVTAQRTGIDLDELVGNSETMKRIMRITPQIDASGAGVIRFRVGGQHTPDGPVVWKDWRTFQSPTRYKVDVRATYRYLAWEIECDAQTWFRMASMDVDVEEVSRR